MNNHKNSGGKIMSSTKDAARLSLLASASLIGALAAGCVIAAPATTLAAVNPCGDDPASDGAADTIVCPVATYATGIEHTAVGDLDLTVQLGSNFGTGGVVTTAGASPADPDDLVVRFSGGQTGSTVSLNTQAFPRLFDVQSQAGDVLVDLSLVRSVGTGDISLQANNAATTHAIYAISHAGGDVQVLRSAPAKLSLNATGAASVAAIEARSIGGGDVVIAANSDFSVHGGQYGILASADGAGSVDIQLETAVSGSPAAQGRLYGIHATAAGSGSLTINADGSTSGSSGLYGIHATTGSGLLTINGFGNSNVGAGVFIDAGGDAVFTGRATGGQYGIDIADVAGGTTTTLNLIGSRSASNGSVAGTTGGLAAIRAQGAGDLLVNVIGAQAAMNFDFNGMSAPVQVNVRTGGAWAPTPNAGSVVPGGNFSINIEEGAALIAGVRLTSSNNALEPATAVTFTDPAMSLSNAGVILIGSDNDEFGLGQHEAELRLIGLNEFRHSGVILLGGRGPGTGSQNIQGANIAATDAWYDDMLVFQDGNWIGEGGKIFFDVELGDLQVDCTREAVTNDFAAADCLRIIDSTVEGVTYVNINQIVPGDRGRLTQQMMDDGILLIDAPGSTITADNFQIDPTVRGFNPRSQSLDKGIYQYVFLFDEGASQFKLYPTLSGAAYQLPMGATLAHNLWRLSTGSWLERQADLRGGMETGVGGGVWLRASGERTERDVVRVSTLGGQPYEVDTGYEADTYAVTGGVDLLSASEESMGYVVGLTAGYAHTDVDYPVSANTQAMDAWSGGAYASFIYGGLFVDAVVNANNVIIDTDIPGADLRPEGTIVSSRIFSVGGQVEAGWRFSFGDGYFAEPLASVSYVRSQMEDLQINPDDFSRPGLAISFEDPSSLRAGVGGRIGMDREFAGVRTQFSVLGKAWNDLEAKNTASIHNLAFPDDPDIRVTDDFSGQFNELAVGAAVYSPGGAVSGFLNLGGKFGDDYEAKTGSVGVRVAW